MTAGEWIIGSPHRARQYCDAPLLVWLDDGSVRRVQLQTDRLVPCYQFAEVSGDLLQNAICDPEHIQAWRFAAS